MLHANPDAVLRSNSGPLRLVDLDATFLAYLGEGRIRRDVSYEQAQGIRFLCPKCLRANAGLHSVMCWRFGVGVPDTMPPLPGRWVFSGAGLHDLTFDAPPGKSNSVQLLGGCGWHGFVTRGAVTIL